MLRAAAIFLLTVFAAEAAPFITISQAPGTSSWSFEKDGQRFYSMGICHVAAKEEARDKGRGYDGVAVRGSVEKWADAAVERMTTAGFNTAGAWCDDVIYARPMARTRLVWLGMEVDGIKQRLVNVFSPGYEAAVDGLCREYVAPHKDDPWLIGWFLDNELPWYGEFGWPQQQKSLLELALALPPQDANRRHALAFLQLYYANFDRFSAEWQTSAKNWEELVTAPRPKDRRAELAKMAWAGEVAERFFSVAVAAVKKYDPNHLVLGCRFASNAPGPVLAACARHCDVVSINRYQKDGSPTPDWWDRIFAIVQKPIMVTEFSWRATENRSGNRNRSGADVTVSTQAERAQRYASYVPAMMARPYIVGMHWFQWADEPDTGRSFDGEDSNYGLVDTQDREYAELMTAAKTAHASLPPPSKRNGPLPAPADRDGTLWSAPPMAELPAGKLSGPVEMLGSEPPYPAMDDKTGARGSAKHGANGWELPVETGTGWGLSFAWPIAPGTKLAGGHAVRVVASGPAGFKLRVTFNELGLDQPAPGGVADGEAWGTPEQALGAGETTLVFDLRDAEVNPYYGKQGGNRRLDLDGLGVVGIGIPGGQGAGTVVVKSVKLE